MLMNSSENAATLLYGPNGFRVIRPGHFVTCAVSGMSVPLEELRYWSVDLQEAYASPDLATRRVLDAK
ncbi:hypothetical protein CP97_01855 [Aurantiacibacter atlanticus]|uniref:DUF2093 domain-containing protein n=1 Tax=Aurantiacibacter atlanticus TaxID=1648404 RepID=A0A0H4VD90_9SPHN|nr:DUF2093 domain-containing protein [Aurantiacibacter atlanticus]AKQ41054.1 hypothetical protein CP97_01855 [Aurantiacibacter atlanticus]MDF1833526.1 DUF2093 domain-containing protein [Alteraurantiacibacter sp. bin_em_oilr2.035]